jgi:TonB family protein
MVADGAGVTVNLNGSQLMHRTPVSYPAEAIAKGVEGTVVVQVRLDSNGEVIDAAVLSGPDELRKGVQQSVLNWHFDKSAGSATRVVNIDFAKPPNAPVIPATVAPVPTRVQIAANGYPPGGRGGGPAPQNPQAAQPSSEQLYLFMQEQIAQAEQKAARSNDPADAAVLQQLRTKLEQFKAENAGKLPMVAPSATVERIDVRGLSDSATAQLQSQLSVHAGDAYSPETFRDVARIAHQFDEHLTVNTTGNGSGAYTIRIATPDSGSMVTNTPSASLPNPGPAGAAHIGGNVMAVNLINPVKPIYPPLAKMARQQGTVKFQATIDKEGKVEDLMLISGPPLLVQSAMDAVRQWVYKPTLLNGAPVEVVTTVDVNYSLSDGGFTPPGQ